MKGQDLTSERSFIGIFSLYTTFNKYNVETEYDEEYDEDIRVLYTMENQPETKEKIEKAIEFYTKKIHDGYSMNDNHFYMKSSINVYLLTFARKLIRSFFDFHAENKYYDRHVATFVNEKNKVSLRQYLEAYDLFEVLAVNLMISMKNLFGINIFPNSLKELENQTHYPAEITNLENWDPENQTMINFIYQYEAINEELTREDCKKLNNE
uniref:Uncharacterized protein n=1 Tax=Meloidogyne floridensis TaxID=298350 RepID=A0A915NJI4_9BILA